MRPLARTEEEDATSNTRSNLQVELACGAVAPSPHAATPPRPQPGTDGWGLGCGGADEVSGAVEAKGVAGGVPGNGMKKVRVCGD
jgi:hypothetical protein